MAVLGLRFCARAFSSCGKWGPLFIAVRGPLTVAASLVAEHRLQTRRLSNHGSRAQPLRGMWDPPRPGLEPVSPASAGRLPTTAPPGKPTERFNKLPRVTQGQNSGLNPGLSWTPDHLLIWHVFLSLGASASPQLPSHITDPFPLLLSSPKPRPAWL